MRAVLGLGLLVLLVACSGDGGNDSGGSSESNLVAYDATDPCSAHADEAACSADAANGCTWFALGMPCPAETECPGGVCQQPDPCGAHDDQASCDADPDCSWAAVELCPPPGDDCPGGFCNTRSDGCACACPLYCPAEGECPPCECECPPDGGGGGGGSGGDGCVCSCAACEPGETCAPCECSCVEPGDPGCGTDECSGGGSPPSPGTG